MQNELIIECLEHEYSVGGVAGMGELLAEANGIGREYAALINQLSRCSNVIIAGLDGSGYFDRRIGAYNQFNIIFGQKPSSSEKFAQFYSQVYDAQIEFVLPYAVQAWIKNEPIQINFIQYKTQFYNQAQHKKDVFSIHHKIANRFKKSLKQLIGRCESDWVISLQINHTLGETIIPKSE
jgi:hypothetical protein